MLKSNASENYICPICLGVQGEESLDTLMKASDIAYKDDLITGFINSFFVGKNAGHVILVSNKHFESIYNLPAEYGHRVSDWPILPNARAMLKKSKRYSTTNHTKVFISHASQTEHEYY